MVWYVTEGKEMVKIVYHREVMEIRKVPWKPLLKTNCLTFALLFHFIRINQIQFLKECIPEHLTNCLLQFLLP